MSDPVRRMLAEVSEAATSFLETTDDYDQLLATIARSCATTLHATCTVSLIDDAAQTVTHVAVHDESAQIVAEHPALHRPVPFGDTILRGMPESDVLFAPSLDAEALMRVSAGGRQFATAVGIRGYVVVGMRVRGKRIGALSVLRHRADLPPLDERDRDLAIHLARFAGLAIANARDHHRVVHAEVVKRSEQRLLELSQFLDAILDEIPTAVFVKDAETFAFVRVNRASTATLGKPPSFVIGKSVADFMSPELAKISFAADREVIVSGKLVDQPETLIPTPNGPRWVHTRKVPIRDSAGVTRWLLGITHDITDLHDAVGKLQLANAAAEAANKELEAFSYSVAHDLRTPLRAIDGFSQALMEDYAGQLDATGRSHLERVRAAAQRMALLIDDLLKLARVTRTEMRRVPVDLGELFRMALAAHQKLDPSRAVDVVIADDLRTVGDPQLLAVAFANLCENAWKFTGKRDDARIELGVRRERDERVYFVRDNGVGFDMQYAGKLFGVFQRLHSEAEFPGTGVGLATVARIVQRHGGRVWADSELGNGATFSFTLGAS